MVQARKVLDRNMTRVLSELLNAKEPDFSNVIKSLNGISVRDSVDIKLTAEIVGKTHMKLRALGLDPRDTTGAELYQALISLALKHDDFLTKYFGGSATSDVAELTPLIVNSLNSQISSHRVLALKNSALKRIIKKSPPKKVMTKLGYRSVDSLIKREPVENILLGIKLVEAKDWQKKFYAQYGKFKPTDFELRPITTKFYDETKLITSIKSYVNETKNNLITISELGLVVCLPPPVNNISTYCLTMALLISRRYVDLLAGSSFLRLKQVHNNFNEVFVRLISSGEIDKLVIAGVPFSWDVIYEYICQNIDDFDIEMISPNLQPSDFSLTTAEDIIFNMEPALHFWADTDYVAVELDGQIISFNILDAVLNASGKVSFGHQRKDNFRASLWHELLSRYLKPSTVEEWLAT